MELQFEEKSIRFLCRTAWGEKSLEQTADIRLPEQERSPDMILGAWGQPVLMEKEWSGDTVSVSGGVNVWVLLRGQEDAALQCVEGWVPFRQSWDLHDSRKDGTANVVCSLKGIDARMTGAGKLIVTAQLSMYLQALEACSAAQYEPRELPGDIYTLKQSKPVCIPVEAGEKRTSTEEEMVIQPGKPDVSRILFYRLEPEVFERRIMSDKLVFRGAVKMHLVYASEDGAVSCTEGEFPVSQYIQLDGEYGSNASADVMPVLTSGEVEKRDDGRVMVRCGALWQYIIHDAVPVSVVEDAYSNAREVEKMEAQIRLPQLVAREDREQEAECAFQTEAAQVVDCAVMASLPRYDERTGQTEMDGTARILYYDENDRLQSAVSSWSAATEVSGSSGEDRICCGQKSASVEYARGEDRLSAHIALPVGMYVVNDRAMDWCSGLVASDEPKKKEHRPSLILRRADDRSIWQLAKLCGSSEKVIREANGIEGDMTPGRMLLIPVE